MNEESNLGSIDILFTKRFDEILLFTNGKYLIELLCYKKELRNVTSNYQVALATLRIVKKRLKNQALAFACGETNKQHLQIGIVKINEMSYCDYSKYILILYKHIKIAG